MNGLVITTGTLNIPIIRDGTNVGTLSFDPTDVQFAQRLFSLIGDFEKQLLEYQKKGKELSMDDVSIIDELPENFNERMNLMNELCKYTRGQIDLIFGEGISDMLFGSSLNLEVFPQFFDGLKQHVKVVRDDKIAKYIPNRPVARAVRGKKVTAKGKKTKK